MYISQYPALDLDAIFQKADTPKIPFELWKKRTKDHAFLFSKGKWALASLVSAYIQLQKKDIGQIFIPEYFCEISLTPLRMAGHRLFFYRIAPSLEPDIDYLDNMVKQNGKPDMMLFVHYFGVPIDIKKSKSWCNENEVMIIEDAAHTIASVPGIGDNECPVFYTPWKFLGCPEGAILVLPSEMQLLGNLASPENDSFYYSLKFSAKSSMDHISMLYGFPLHKFKKWNVKDSNESEPLQDPGRAACGSFSIRFLSLLEKSIAAIMRNRKNNYMRLDKIIMDSKISDYRLIKNLAETFAP